MDISVTQVQGRVPVTILRTAGDIDHASYEQLLATTQALFEDGARHLLLDLGQTAYMSSSGLVALQSIARMLSGEGMPNLEHGWSAIHSLGDERDYAGTHPSLKLLNVQPEVERVLAMVELKEHFDFFTDESQAVAAF